MVLEQPRTTELHVTGNVHNYAFRKTPGFFTKVDIWKGEEIQILIHIFAKNQPQDGVIHNHNHGFYFQNISLEDDAMYKTSQYEFDQIGEETVYRWSREQSSGKLKAIKPQKGKLLKVYEHDYKNGITGFTEQNTLHHVSEAKGQVMSFIVREAKYHGNQEILSREPKLPEDQLSKIEQQFVLLNSFMSIFFADIYVPENALYMTVVPNFAMK